MTSLHSVFPASPTLRTTAATVASGDLGRSLRHVVALERRLTDEELTRVAAAAAPELAVSAERLRTFLERRGVEPLSTSLDAWSSVTLADTLRSAGAPVRVWTTRLTPVSDPGETWSGVRIGRPDTLDEAGDTRVRTTLVVRAAPDPTPIRWRRIVFWGGVAAFWVAAIVANVLLLD